jgi:hypothetical protein
VDAVGTALIAVGAFMLYSAVTGHHPLTVVRSAIATSAPGTKGVT